MILHFIDYLIVAAYFLVIILVGLLAKKGESLPARNF